MKKKERYKIYKKLRDQGATYHDIAKIFGIDSHTVGKFCRENGLDYSKDELRKIRSQSATKKTEKEWSEQIFKIYHGAAQFVCALEKYDERSERQLLLKCSECGTSKILSSVTLRQPRKWQCGECLRRKKEQAEKEKEYLKEGKRLLKEINKPFSQVEFPLCKCGKIIPIGRSKCDECKIAKQRERYRRKETKRRQRCSGGDWSITLQDVYEKNHGICYLCGSKCDWNDYQLTDGVFYAGSDYPSIDHVIPLSKGGKHERNNVRLAHFKCNTMKGNK